MITTPPDNNPLYIIFYFAILKLLFDFFPLFECYCKYIYLKLPLIIENIIRKINREHDLSNKISLVRRIRNKIVYFLYDLKDKESFKKINLYCQEKELYKNSFDELKKITGIKKYSVITMIRIFNLLLFLFSSLIIYNTSNEFGYENIVYVTLFFVITSYVVVTGIIDFCWYAIIIASCGMILLCNQLSALSDSNIIINANIEYYKIAYHTTEMFFENTMTSIICIATLVTVSMSIIWSKAPWKKKEVEDKLEYFWTCFSSMRMVFAAVFISTAAIIWIGLPLYLKLERIIKFTLNAQ